MGPSSEPQTYQPHQLLAPLPPPPRPSKSLLLATWLIAISLLAITACTIYLAVLSTSFLDTTERHLAAIGNNTRAIFAALADDDLDLRGFRYGTWGSDEHLSLRSNLGMLRRGVVI